jgi:hypothetical protein
MADGELALSALGPVVLQTHTTMTRTRRLTAADNDLLTVMSKLAPQHVYSRYIFVHLLLLARQKNPVAGAAYVLHLAQQLDRIGIYDERIERFFVHVCQGNIGAMATLLDAYASLSLNVGRLLDAIEHRYPLDYELYAREILEDGANYPFCLRGSLTQLRNRSIVHLEGESTDVTPYLEIIRNARPPV